jgi:hypothetical protein
VSSMVDIVLLVALIVSLATVYLYNRKPKPSHPLPPGPPQAFFYGNARDVPAVHKEIKFAEWGKKYGTFFLSLTLLTKIINTKAFVTLCFMSFRGLRRSRRVSQRLRPPHNRSKHG